MASAPAPLFKHPRLIAAALLAVLAIVNAVALYVRPLSGELPPMTKSSGGQTIAAGSSPIRT